MRTHQKEQRPWPTSKIRRGNLRYQRILLFEKITILSDFRNLLSWFSMVSDPRMSCCFSVLLQAWSLPYCPKIKPFT